MANEEEMCNTTLGLGFGLGIKKEKQSKQNKRGFWLDLSLPLHPKTEVIDHVDHDHKYDDENDDQNSVSFKTLDEHEEKEEERRIKRSVSNIDVYNNNDGSRKKLKLTTEQTTLLEDSFKIHSTLNTGHKQELAKKLNLLPRQIEVWFQNRRARTKLKQIEQECEFLRKCCETLNDENRRLKKELQECSSLKFDNHQQPPQPPLSYYIRSPSTLVMHHPCTKIEKSAEEMKTVVVVNGGSMGQMHDDSKVIKRTLLFLN